MRRLVWALLLISHAVSLSACRKPANAAPNTPPPSTPDTYREQSDDQQAAPAPTGLAFSDWRQIDITIAVDPQRGPQPSIVGFDKVSTIVARDNYGPCASCHTSQWPYLSSEGWPRLLDSLKESGHDITTKEDLAALIVSCVDQASEQHCAGDPDDKTDTIDYKMPSRFGYDPMTPQDLNVLKQWLADGAHELSQESRDGIVPSDIAGIDIGGVTPASSEVRLLADKLKHTTGSVQFSVEARFAGDCSDARLKLDTKRADGSVISALIVPLTCEGGTFLTTGAVSL